MTFGGTTRSIATMDGRSSKLRGWGPWPPKVAICMALNPLMTLELTEMMMILVVRESKRTTMGFTKP